MKNHTPRFLALVAVSKKRVTEITPQTLKEKLDQPNPPRVIDVREESEWHSSEHIPTAIHLSKGVLECNIETLIPDPTTPLVVYCSGGFRCALVADALQQMGYTEVSSLATGLQGWLDADFETEANDILPDISFTSLRSIDLNDEDEE